MINELPKEIIYYKAGIKSPKIDEHQYFSIVFHAKVQDKY